MSETNTSQRELKRQLSVGDDDENMAQTFEKIKLEKDVAVLMKEKMYREAIELLSRLQTMQSNQWRLISTFISITVCQFLLEEHHATKSLDNLVKKLINIGVDGGEVEKMAVKFEGNENYLDAFVMYYSACKIYTETSTGDNAVMHMQSCVTKISQLVQDYLYEEEEEEIVNEVEGIDWCLGAEASHAEYLERKAAKRIVTGHIIPALKEVAQDISTIDESSYAIRVENQAWCLLYIGLCHRYCGEDAHYAKMSESAIELMKGVFRQDAKLYKVLAFCFNNAGVAYESMNKTTKAVENYKNAIAVYRSAADYKDESSRKEDIKLTEINLKMAVGQ